MIALNLESIIKHINSAIDTGKDREGKSWTRQLWRAYENTAPERIGSAYFEFFKAVAEKAMGCKMEETSRHAIDYACAIAREEDLGLAAYDDFMALANNAIRAGLKEASKLALAGMELASEEFRKKSLAGLSEFSADYKKLIEHYELRFQEKFTFSQETESA